MSYSHVLLSWPYASVSSPSPSASASRLIASSGATALPLAELEASRRISSLYDAVSAQSGLKTAQREILPRGFSAIEWGKISPYTCICS